MTKKTRVVLEFDLKAALALWIKVIAFFLVAGFVLSHPVAALALCAVLYITLNSLKEKREEAEDDTDPEQS